MENLTTINCYRRIKALIPSEKFRIIETRLAGETNTRLEAFLNIIIAGYTIDFALANYKKLYEYLKNKPIGYSEALRTYSIYPGLESGIYITKTKWFELN